MENKKPDEQLPSQEQVADMARLIQVAWAAGIILAMHGMHERGYVDLKESFDMCEEVLMRNIIMFAKHAEPLMERADNILTIVEARLEQIRREAMMNSTKVN